MVLQNPDKVQHWLLHGLLRMVAGRSSWKRNPPWRNPETIEVYTAVCDNVCWRLADISTLVEEEREVVVLHFKVPIEQQRTIVAEDTDVCGINFKDWSCHHHSVPRRIWTITKKYCEIMLKTSN